MSKVEYYRGAMLTVNGNFITSITNKDQDGNINYYPVTLQLTNNWRKNKLIYQFLDAYAIIEKG